MCKRGLKCKLSEEQCKNQLCFLWKSEGWGHTDQTGSMLECWEGSSHYKQRRRWCWQGQRAKAAWWVVQHERHLTSPHPQKQNPLDTTSDTWSPGVCLDTCNGSELTIPNTLLCVREQSISEHFLLALSCHPSGSNIDNWLTSPALLNILGYCWFLLHKITHCSCFFIEV